MIYKQIQNTDDAFKYLAECSVWSIDNMINMKDRNPFDIAHQVAVAQEAIGLLQKLELEPEEGSLLSKIINNHAGSVEAWISTKIPPK